MTYEIIVTSEFDSVKPKNFLKKKLDLPYNKLFKYIKEKRITLNGKKIKEESILKKGDVIKVWLDEIKLRQETRVQRESRNLKIDTIFENDDFLVLNKPSGIIVQGAQDNQTSLSLHLSYLKNKNKDLSSFDYFHVHRIDKDTSGILVAAKTPVALRDLNEIFRDRTITKTYLALCCGEFQNKTGEIKLKLQRNEQGLREKVIEQNKSIKSEWVKDSHSIYRVIDEYKYNNETFSLVEIEIKTGVMHQIRVHMKHLGNPIVGDRMYGKMFVNKEFENILPRQFLHASSVKFEYKKKKFNFEAPFLYDLNYCLSNLKKI